MKNINIKGSGFFFSLSTEIYTITLSEWIKEDIYIYFPQDFINNYNDLSFKAHNSLGLSSLAEIIIDHWLYTFDPWFEDFDKNKP